MKRYRWKQNERLKAEDRIKELKESFLHWDDIRDTKDCPHCEGTGLAPGDGATECGFCTNQQDKEEKETE